MITKRLQHLPNEVFKCIYVFRTSLHIARILCLQLRTKLVIAENAVFTTIVYLHDNRVLVLHKLLSTTQWLKQWNWPWIALDLNTVKTTGFHSLFEHIYTCMFANIVSSHFSYVLKLNDILILFANFIKRAPEECKLTVEWMHGLI